MVNIIFWFASCQQNTAGMETGAFDLRVYEALSKMKSLWASSNDWTVEHGTAYTLIYWFRWSVSQVECKFLHVLIIFAFKIQQAIDILYSQINFSIESLKHNSNAYHETERLENHPMTPWRQPGVVDAFNMRIWLEAPAGPEAALEQLEPKETAMPCEFHTVDAKLQPLRKINPSLEVREDHWSPFSSRYGQEFLLAIKCAPPAHFVLIRIKRDRLFNLYIYI